MNFSRILSIYMLVIVIFTAPISAMQEHQTQSHNIFARSLSKVASTLDKAVDLFIKYALVKPAQMWFESQPVSEQERIVLESDADSNAHEIFKKNHGEEAYHKLLKESWLNACIRLENNGVNPQQNRTLSVTHRNAVESRTDQ